MVSEKALCNFVKDRADSFLAVSKLVSKLTSADRSRGAEEVVQRLNTLRGTVGFDKNGKHKLRREVLSWVVY